MIPVMCIVQDQQITPSMEIGLKAEISNFTQRTFSAPADIDWIVVSHGNGFTAGLPSSTVVASLHANRPLKTPERVALLQELNAICIAQTGRTAHEVVTSIRNPED